MSQYLRPKHLIIKKEILGYISFIKEKVFKFKIFFGVKLLKLKYYYSILTSILLQANI